MKTGTAGSQTSQTHSTSRGTLLRQSQERDRRRVIETGSPINHFRVRAAHSKTLSKMNDFYDDKMSFIFVLIHNYLIVSDKAELVHCYGIILAIFYVHDTAKH